MPQRFRRVRESNSRKLRPQQFLEDYQKLLKPYLDDDYGGEIRKTPDVDVLLNQAEQDFIQSYGGFPTCAVYAPGCLTIAGKCTNLAESKSLSMAVQLVTLIVGKRSRDNKWCHVKTLLDEFAKENTYKFYMNDENLQICMEEPSWVRYLKGIIKCFKAKRGIHPITIIDFNDENLRHVKPFFDGNVVTLPYRESTKTGPLKMNVPGFEIVIVSTVPVKCGLGSSSALVVAMYTFLEAITNTQTTNVLEKTLICYLAQRLASGCQHHRIADSLISIIGNEDKIIAFSSRSLTISNYDFSETVEAEMVLIEFPNFDVGKSSKYRLDESRRKEILIIKNTKSRWRNNPEGASMMERLFSEETMTLTENILNEDKRISQMIQAIQTKRWKKLGKLLWRNYQYTRKSLNVLPDDIECVMTTLESAEYVLGASFISRGSGASVFVLVQRSRFRSFISLMNSMEVPRGRYYKIKPFTGATILYTHERHVSSNDAEPRRRYRQSLKAKYHLRDNDSMQSNNKYFQPLKSMSFFILADTSV